jgi:hypothetical protein
MICQKRCRDLINIGMGDSDTYSALLMQGCLHDRARTIQISTERFDRDEILMAFLPGIKHMQDQRAQYLAGLTIPKVLSARPACLLA